MHSALLKVVWMRYEKFNPDVHDVLKVAELVYDVDFRTFDMLFKSKESAVGRIAESIRGDDLDPFLVVLDDNGEVIGILIYYVSKFPKHFNFKSLRLLIVDILDYFVLCDVGEGDMYIAEVAIDKSLRGKGLGRRVVTDSIEWAKSQNLKRVILDADFRNTGAKALYERIGFKQYNKKRVKIGKFERGMYNMEYRL